MNNMLKLVNKIFALKEIPNKRWKWWPKVFKDSFKNVEKAMSKLDSSNFQNNLAQRHFSLSITYLF